MLFPNTCYNTILLNAVKNTIVLPGHLNTIVLKTMVFKNFNSKHGLRLEVDNEPARFGSSEFELAC
jgi:hypothetical protein